MNLHSFSILLLLTGLGDAFSEPAYENASLTSTEAQGAPPDAAADADRSDVRAPHKLPPMQERSGTTGEEAPLSPATPQVEKQSSEGSSEGERAYEKNHVVRGHLHVDLSLSNNVELLARLAPLLQRLMAEQEALSSCASAAAASPAGSSAAAATPSSHSVAGVEEVDSDASAVAAKTAEVKPPRAARPNIQLELSYHIFDMELDPTSAPHCVTGDLGRFCAFPPDDVPYSSGERQQQVGGRAVAEEELLQLCLAEAARQNWFAGATAAADAAADRAVESNKAAPTEDAAAGNARESNTALKRTATAAPAQSNAASTSGSCGSTGQQLKLVWDYLAGWCCNCSTRKHSCSPEEGAGTAGGQHTPQGFRENLHEERAAKEYRLPFQAACSRAQLEKLHVPVALFMERCEKAAAEVLQHQVDSRLSVVPSLLINGKPALGELTAESVLKTLCLVAEEQAAAAVSRGASALRLPAVCRAPEILSSPTLAVKSFGVGVNSDFIQDLDSGAPGELEVAAHLLNTFARSPEGLATQQAAPTRPGLDTEGRYHFVNRKALRFLRKRLMARRRLKRSNNVPAASAEQASTAFSYGSGAATPIPARVDAFWKPASGSEEASAAAAGDLLAENRGRSNTRGGIPAAVEKEDAVSQQAEAQAAVPLALDGPPPFYPSVLLSEDNFSVEEGKRFRHGVFGPLTLKQHNRNEAMAETSTPVSEQLTDIVRPAHVSPGEGRTESTACLHPDDAAEAAVSRGHMFNADTMTWHLQLLLGLLLFVAVIAWLLKRRGGAPLAAPPRQLREPAAHEAALLDDKHLQDASSRKL